MTDFDRTSDDLDFLEFTRCYESGDRVDMRGLKAASFLIKKHDLKPDEAVAFTSWQGARRAMTVFHFHPGFDRASMRAYMESHEDGIQLLKEVRAQRGDVGGAEWLSLVRGTGLAREIAQATLQAFAREITEVMAQFVRGLLWQGGRIEPETAMKSPPPPPTPVLSGFEVPIAKTFPVVRWPSRREPALAILAGGQPTIHHPDPVSVAIH